jgi:hypothetical protein
MAANFQSSKSCSGEADREYAHKVTLSIKFEFEPLSFLAFSLRMCLHFTWTRTTHWCSSLNVKEVPASPRSATTGNPAGCCKLFFQGELLYLSVHAQPTSLDSHSDLCGQASIKTKNWRRPRRWFSRRRQWTEEEESAGPQRHPLAHFTHLHAHSTSIITD